jgi:hypothetical protein
VWPLGHDYQLDARSLRGNLYATWKTRAQVLRKYKMQAIIKRLEEKTKDVCPRCQKTTMVVMPGITLIPLAYPTHLYFTNPHGLIPCITVMCAECGRLDFFNVHILGLAQELGVPTPGFPIAPPVSPEKVEVKNG